MCRILALFFAVVLLCGCAPLPPEATNPSPMAGGENVGTVGNLWYLPNKAVEDMDVTALRKMEDGLLLAGIAGGTTLVKLSEEDLSLRSEITLEGSGMPLIQVLDDGIALTTPGDGGITILNAALEVTDTRSVEDPANTRFLSSDGQTLYGIRYQKGITAYDPETETTRELLAAQILSVIARTDRTVTMAYVGTEDLLIRWCELDLATGSLTEPDKSRRLALQEGLQPLATGGYLARKGRTLTIYDAGGGFVSACGLPGGEDDYAGDDFVWSEQWQGWFFIDHYEGTSRLMFWDPAVETSGDGVDITPETVPGGEVLAQELYDRAAELSARFDVDIRLADQCIRDYKSYNSEMLTDPERISAVLDLLEEALSLYPEGFVTQLKFSDVETIRIEIISELTPKSNMDAGIKARSFTQKREGYYLMVLSGDDPRSSSIHHELTHVIDRRLEWDASLRRDALFSEAQWMTLQPEGFQFAESYKDIPESVTAYYDSGYFVRKYACTFPTEDRATIMEAAMTGGTDIFQANPGLIPKLEYYSACIRDSFNTDGWPEVTFWEQILQ